MKKMIMHIVVFIACSTFLCAQNNLETPPAGFSPDGDGVSDTFDFQAASMKEMKVEIVDASGVIVFKCEEDEKCTWDGIELKGRPAPEGTYIYTQTVVGLDEKVYRQSGKILLRRNK